jgi:6-phosphofructokinase 2
MNVDAQTFCIIAGDIGQLLQRLLKQQLINVHYEHIDGETRINSTIIEIDTKTQYQVTDAGIDIPQQQVKTIIENFVAHTGNGFGIITGSCQSNVPNTLYADLVEHINANGGKSVVDTHGEALRSAIDAKPFLIKPNLYELETIIKRELPTIHDIAKEARRLQRQGIKHVCVSLGDKGAVLVSPDNSYHAQALDVTVNSTVGAGDSMVAGLMAGLSLEGGPQYALRLGIACGAGTVMHPGTELFSGLELVEFRQGVNIETLNI